jgi:hypothetical protein
MRQPLVKLSRHTSVYWESFPSSSCFHPCLPFSPSGIHSRSSVVLHPCNSAHKSFVLESPFVCHVCAHMLCSTHTVSGVWAPPPPRRRPHALSYQKHLNTHTNAWSYAITHICAFRIQSDKCVCGNCSSILFVPTLCTSLACRMWTFGGGG